MSYKHFYLMFLGTAVAFCSFCLHPGMYMCITWSTPQQTWLACRAANGAAQVVGGKNENSCAQVCGHGKIYSSVC